jgi:precorrin-2 methylase
VKVIVKSQKDRESVEKLNIKDILIVIKTKEPKEAVKEIIAARRLLSGDILLSTLTEKARIIFKKNNEWLRAVTLTAEVL